MVVAKTKSSRGDAEGVALDSHVKLAKFYLGCNVGIYEGAFTFVVRKAAL
jgi:hypothetical protein